jgi:Fe-S-cluster containining protein
MDKTLHIQQKALNVSVHNKKFLAHLKRNVPKNLDKTMSQLHEEVFEYTSCLSCANCCKTTSPIFYERDIERAAKYLKMRPAHFTEKFLCIDEDKDYVLKNSPCPFLQHDNTCSIYEHRPNACREYPHTQRKKYIRF